MTEELGTQAGAADLQGTAGAQTETAAQSTAGASATAPNFSTVIGADGKLAENWKSTLPEDIQHELCLDTFQDFPEMARSYVNAQKMIGKNKIVLPTDKSPQAEIDAFQIACGRPKTKDEYKIAAPKGMEEYFDEWLMAEARNMAFGLGFNQKQMDALVAFRGKEIELGIKQKQEEEERAFAEAEKAITEEAGEALDEQRHFADMLIANEYPDEAKQAKLLEALNANPLRPYVFNFLAGIYRKYCAPHDGITAGQESSAMTPAMMEAKAQELMATPGYGDGTMKNNNPAGYDRLTREITDLYNRATQAAQKAAKV
jgi:hypothetical protein